MDEKKLQTTLEQELPKVRLLKSKPALDCYTKEVVDAIQTAIGQATLLTNHSTRARIGWTKECKEAQAAIVGDRLARTPFFIVSVSQHREKHGVTL